MSTLVRGGLLLGGSRARSRLVSVVDATPPTPVSATIDSAGTSLTIVWSEAINTGSVPASSAFAISGVTTTLSGGSATLTTTTYALSPAVEAGAAALLAYTPPGSNKIKDLAGNNAVAFSGFACTNNSSVTPAPLFVSGVRKEIGTGQQVAYANDDVNTIVYRQEWAVTDPATGDEYAAWYSNGSPARLVLAMQTGGTGPWTVTAATSITLPNSITDDHNTIHLGIVASRLVVCFNCHSNQMILGMAPTARSIALDSTWMLSTPTGSVAPVVAGNTTIEANATYAAFYNNPAGDLFMLWRSGGAGAGNNYLYKWDHTAVAALSAGASLASMRACITQHAFVLNGVGSTVACSYYYNNPICEGSAGANPGRHWISTQARDGSALTSSHGLWLIYSDGDGADGTWRDWKTGTLLPSGAIDTDLTNAVVENIPKQTTDPLYDNYFGNQGMCVGLDGVPTIVMGYGQLDGTGTNWGGFTIYGWRCKAGVVYKRALYSPGTLTTRLGRPKPVWLDTAQRLVAFFPETDTSIDTVGRMSYATASGDSLSNVGKGSINVLNGVNDIMDAQFLHNNTKWLNGSGTLEAMWMRCGFVASSPAVTPEILKVSFSTVSMPSDYTYTSVLGSAEYEFRADQCTVDGSGNVSDIVDLTGNLGTISQATSSKRPLYVANAINGLPAWYFDGVDDVFDFIRSRTAPSSSNVFTVYALMRQLTGDWVSGRRLLDLNGALMFATGSTGQFKQNHGSSSNAGTLTVGAWKRVILQFTGGVNASPADAPLGDYVKAGAVAPAASLSSGSTIASTSCRIGDQVAGGLPAKFQLAHMVAWVKGASPTRPQIFDLDGVTLKRYGATPLA